MQKVTQAITQKEKTAKSSAPEDIKAAKYYLLLQRNSMIQCLRCKEGMPLGLLS